MKDEGRKRDAKSRALLFTLPPSSFILASVERSHSGLVHRSRKPEWVYAHRGFESHPLRHELQG